MTDPRFNDPRYIDPRYSDPVLGDKDVGGAGGSIAGIAIIALIVIGIIVGWGWNHNKNTASNNSPPTATGSAGHAIQPSTTGSDFMSAPPLMPLPRRGTQ